MDTRTFEAHTLQPPNMVILVVLLVVYTSRRKGNLVGITILVVLLAVYTSRRKGNLVGKPSWNYFANTYKK